MGKTMTSEVYRILGYFVRKRTKLALQFHAEEHERPTVHEQVKDVDRLREFAADEHDQLLPQVGFGKEWCQSEQDGCDHEYSQRDPVDEIHLMSSVVLGAEQPQVTRGRSNR